MSLGAVFDRKYLSKILNLDEEFKGIKKDFDYTKENIKELAKEIKDNSDRILKLETNFQNCKENCSVRIKNTFYDLYDKKQLLWSQMSQSKNKELPE